MKILRFYAKLPPLRGGMEQHIQWLSQEQDKMGHEVQLYFNQGEKVFPDDQQLLPFLPVHRIRPQLLGILLFYPAVCLRLFFTPVKANFIHIHGDWSSFLFARWIKRLTRAEKIFFSVHGVIDHYRGMRKRLFIRTLRQADQIFCSGYQAHAFISEHRRSVFQPSGIKPVFFNGSAPQKHTRFTLITVANLVKTKKLERILTLARSLPEINFILIGKGPLKRSLQRSVLQDKLNNVILKGFLEPAELFGELKKAHAFLLTSEKEGTPTAILEAMATGLPLIVSNVGGIEKILGPSQRSWLVKDPENSTEWQEKILRLVGDEQNRQKLALENTNVASGFSWENVALSITNHMLNA